MAGQNLGGTISYKDIFPDEPESKTHQELLEGIPSVHVLTYLAYLNMLKSHGAQGDDKVVLAHAIRLFPQKLQEKIVRNYLRHSIEKEEKVHAFNTWTITNMIQDELLHYRDIPVSDTDAEQEIRIFKSYLKFAGQLGDKYDKMLPSADVVKKFPFIEWAWILFPPQLDFVTGIDPLLQLFKAGVVLNYLYSKVEYTQPIFSFLGAKGFSTLEELFANYFNLFFFNFLGDNRNNTNVTALRPHRVHHKLIEHLAIDRAQLKAQSVLQSNLNGLKSRPLIDRGDGTYLIANWNFFHGRIYDSLMFDLWENSDFSKKYESFPDFKADIVQKIIEKFLFRKVVEACFMGSGRVLRFDDAHSGDGFPDAYIREGNRIYLMEFKDVQMPSHVVDSGKYETVRDHIFQKYVRTDKGKKKGITQLAEAIDKLRNPEYFEEEYTTKARNLRIYPIVVYT